MEFDLDEKREDMSPTFKFPTNGGDDLLAMSFKPRQMEKEWYKNIFRLNYSLINFLVHNTYVFYDRSNSSKQDHRSLQPPSLCCYHWILKVLLLTIIFQSEGNKVFIFDQ